jgi:NADP-dependent 3-hydroxy acid dehydrogenase YdfG
VYSASKAALRSFARTWLNELKGRNIRSLRIVQFDRQRLGEFFTVRSRFQDQ